MRFVLNVHISITTQCFIQDFEVGGGVGFQSLALTWRACFSTSLLDALRLILRHSGGTYGHFLL